MATLGCALLSGCLFEDEDGTGLILDGRLPRFPRPAARFVGGQKNGTGSIFATGRWIRRVTGYRA